MSYKWEATLVFQDVICQVGGEALRVTSLLHSPCMFYDILM